MQMPLIACTCLVTHLRARTDSKIHYIVCPHVNSEHHHLLTRLAAMDTQFVADIKTPEALMRRVSTAREFGIHVIDLTHVVHKRRLARFLQAVETVKDGHRYTLRGVGSKHWKVEKPKVVVFCRYGIDQRLLGVPAQYNIEKWLQWEA